MLVNAALSLTALPQPFDSGQVCYGLEMWFRKKSLWENYFWQLFIFTEFYSAQPIDNRVNIGL